MTTDIAAYPAPCYPDDITDGVVEVPTRRAKRFAGMPEPLREAYVSDGIDLLVEDLAERGIGFSASGRTVARSRSQEVPLLLGTGDQWFQSGHAS